MERKIIVGFLGMILLMAVSACKNRYEQDSIPKTEIIRVHLQPLEKQLSSTQIKTSGYFTTDDETPLSFKNGGIVNYIGVKEGDRVRAGQLLATVEGTEVEAGAAQADENLKKAQRDYDRASHLYTDSVATLEQLQNAKTALEVAKQQRRSAEFNRKQSEIRAKSSGTVLKRYVSKGQLVGPGTPVLLLNNSNADWVFKTSLSDVQWASVTIGDSSIITTDYAKQSPIKAKVERKTDGIDPQSGGFSVELSLGGGNDSKLASGLFGTATLFSSKNISNWEIPYEALLDSNDGAGYVFVTNDKKTVQKIKVHIDRISHGKVVINKGLEEVKYIVVSGSAYLKEGSKISAE